MDVVDTILVPQFAHPRFYKLILHDVIDASCRQVS